MKKEVWHHPTCPFHFHFPFFINRLLRILLSGIALTIDKKESKTKVDQQKSFSLKFSNWNLHFSQNSTSSVYIPAFPDLHRHLEVARGFGKGRDSETVQESNRFMRIPLRSKPAVLLFQLRFSAPFCFSRLHVFLHMITLLANSLFAVLYRFIKQSEYYIQVSKSFFFNSWIFEVTRSLEFNFFFTILLGN
jgi:hypothetical protein